MSLVSNVRVFLFDQNNFIRIKPNKNSDVPNACINARKCFKHFSTSIKRYNFKIFCEYYRPLGLFPIDELQQENNIENKNINCYS